MVAFVSGRQAITAPLIERAQPFPDAASYPGAQLLGPDGQVYVSQREFTGGPYAWQIPGGGVKFLTGSVVRTVGAGGDYATLGAALLDLSYTPAPPNSNYTATIRILAGTTLAEQINLDASNLGFVKIISDDAIVPVSGSAVNVVPGAGRPIFILASKCVLPEIDCKFSIISAQSNTLGLGMYNGSTLNMGAVTVAGVLRPSGIIGCTTNLIIDQNSQAQLNYADFNGAGEYGIKVTTNSEVGLFNTNATGGGSGGLYLALNSRASWYGGGAISAMGGQFRNDFRKVSGADDTGATTADILIQAGGSAVLPAGQVLRGGVNLTADTVSASGIFYA